MRSLVTSMWLFTNAFSAALGQALVPLAEDPVSISTNLSMHALMASLQLLVINYGVFAGLSFVGGCLFWYLFRDLDAEESQLNDMRRDENGRPFDERADGNFAHAGQAPAPSAPADIEEKRAV